ncbi:hypothetical protein [Endozoicomonas elysicola]|uniref:hypothetical protein n=1 Tax=Endozoicomonas elysicola TaxID=305900 RepID=UPI00039C6B9E|nr:hypothetical protein [Endozoicomonas elysicola]
MANNKVQVEQAFRSGKKPSEDDFRSFIQLATDAGALDAGTLNPERLPANLNLASAHDGQTTAITAGRFTGDVDLIQQKDVTNIRGAETPYNSLSKIADAMAGYAGQLADLARIDTDNLDAIRGGVQASHDNLQKIKTAMDTIQQDVDANEASANSAVSQAEINAVSTLRGAVSSTYDTLKKVEDKLIAVDQQITQLHSGGDSQPSSSYVAEISGKGATILATTHAQGAYPGLIAQFYDSSGRLMHGVDLVNTNGDIHWATTAPVEVGSYVVIR